MDDEQQNTDSVSDVTEAIENNDSDYNEIIRSELISLNEKDDDAENAEQPKEDSAEEEEFDLDKEAKLLGDDDSDEETKEVESIDDQAEEKEVEFYTLKHSGTEKDVTLEEMKELAQKGYDYTEKTQTLSDERSKMEQELGEVLTDLEKSTTDYDELKSLNYRREMTLEQIKNTNPEIFQWIEGIFAQVDSQFNNPVINNQLTRQNKEIEDLKTALQGQEDQSIRKSFDLEMSAVKSEFGPLAKAHRITPDWDKVKEEWIDGEHDSVRDAFKKLYEEPIRLRMQSKLKVSSTKSKAHASKGTPTVSGSRASREAPNDVDFSSLDYNELANLPLDQLLSS